MKCPGERVIVVSTGKGGVGLPAATMPPTAEQLHRLYLESPYGVVLLDPARTVIYANPAARRMLGSDGFPLVGAEWDALVDVSAPAPADSPAGPDPGAARRHDAEVQAEIRATATVVRIWASPLEWEGRRALLLVLRDITAGWATPEDHRAVAELRESERRFRLLAEYSQDAIFLLRMRPRPYVEYMSPACQAVIGHSPEELTGDLDKVVAVLRPETRAVVIRALRSPRDEPWVFQSRQRDGSMAWFEVRMFAIRDESGEAVAYEGNIRRVTDRVKAERERQRLARQLEHAERLEALGRLAGGVAHDFNNLLAVIAGTAELLGDDIRAGVPQLADVERIAHAAERGAALTRQLLIFSRREPSQPEVLDLNDVVNRIEELLRRTIGETIEFTARLSASPAVARIDRAKLEQVVLNLVLNARAAMEQGGRLTLETDEPRFEEDTQSPGLPEQTLPGGHYVRLTVTDTGSGMTPEVARRAFEPFFTTHEPGGGSGLGLATVHGAVKEAGGFVVLQSRPGEGTTVQVLFPRCAAPVGFEGDAAEPGPPQGGGQTVLVVEDEDPVRDVVTRLLSRNGYMVLTARDSIDALAICADPDQSIDLLLTDLVMPGMSGTQLAERLRATIRPGLRVLYMSGYTAGQHVPDDDDLAPSLLHKPFDADTLLRRVHQMVRTGARDEER